MPVQTHELRSMPPPAGTVTPRRLDRGVEGIGNGICPRNGSDLLQLRNWRAPRQSNSGMPHSSFSAIAVLLTFQQVPNWMDRSCRPNLTARTGAIGGLLLDAYGSNDMLDPLPYSVLGPSSRHRAEFYPPQPDLWGHATQRRWTSVSFPLTATPQRSSRKRPCCIARIDRVDARPAPAPRGPPGGGKPAAPGPSDSITLKRLAWPP